MFVIVSYDVDSKRCFKFFDLLSKYLLHKQNSFFVGDITEKRFNELKRKLFELVIKNDNLVIYVLNSSKYIKEYSNNPESNIICLKF